VRLELGTVLDGVKTTSDCLVQRVRGIILAIQRQPGTNTVEVVDNIKQLLPVFRQEIPPSISLYVAFDASESIRGSIDDVKFTLVLTICLVVMVIFLFLRNLSATLIPGVAVPLSIIGTFAAMYLLGYSLNNLSLMALTLSVGLSSTTPSSCWRISSATWRWASRAWKPRCSRRAKSDSPSSP
jgi:HAE1 family hydrophobic/amphiphilic exporter-1